MSGTCPWPAPPPTLQWRGTRPAGVAAAAAECLPPLAARRLRTASACRQPHPLLLLQAVTAAGWPLAHLPRRLLQARVQ